MKLFLLHAIFYIKVPAYMRHTFRGHVLKFFIFPPPLPHHTFFETFLFYESMLYGL